MNFSPIDGFPTVAEVDRISALADAVIRNLQITQCYHELSSALAQRTGPSANWCSFATWASRQAGQTIRKEDLVRALQNLLATAPATAEAAGNVAASAQQSGAQRDAGQIRELVWEALDPNSAVDRASEAVGRGNLKVFEEIGREFARFLSACLNDVAFDAGKIAAFCQELRPGEPPDGQRYLRQAFERYYQALFESDAKRRAELLLMANVEIGLHEQTRLQPEIAEALDAGFVDATQLTGRLIGAIFPNGGWLVYSLWSLRRVLGRPSLFEMAVTTLAAVAQHQIRQFITEHMMTIGLPHGVQVRLGADLSAGFPPSLQHITDPDLCSLLEQIDPTPDNLHGSGAVDWANLPDRLHFIADLFRCYQESPDLFEPPFTPDQVAMLKAGRLPGGDLLQPGLL